MPIEILDKKLCSGCSACANICPKQCIKMLKDSCGFYYPFVDKTICIDCNLCNKVCPIIDRSKLVASIPISVNAAWSKDEELRYSSTSGGIFSELANQVILEGGCVVGAAYGKDNTIEHQIVNDLNGVQRLKQSKYAQSDMNTVYKCIKSILPKQTVLFSGAPCQVGGLKAFLGKEIPNLITIDFICRGVNSPKAYKYWLQELEFKKSAKVERVWFKYKEDGWKNSPRCTRLDFSNGETIIQKGEENLFMLGYLGPNLYIRPSCGDCRFKGDRRYSDITVGDFWGIDMSLDDDGGTSLLQINTNKGIQLVNSIRKKINIYECTSEDIRRGNICMDNSVKINAKSEEFLQKLGGDIPFSKLVEKYSKKTIIERIKNIAKIYLLK